jgi:hypothetical protein
VKQAGRVRQVKAGWARQAWRCSQGEAGRRGRARQAGRQTADQAGRQGDAGKQSGREMQADRQG